MKKLFVLTVVFSLLLTGSAFSQMKVGVFGGWNMYLSDTSAEELKALDPDAEIDETKGGIGGGLKLGYQMDALTIGAIVGYLPLYDVTLKMDFGFFTMDMSASLTDIPIILFGQYNIGDIYVLGGAGIHLTAMEAEVSVGGVSAGATSDSGSNLGITFGAGYELPLSDSMGLDIGALFHMILATEETVDTTTGVVTEESVSYNNLDIHLGINFKL